MKRFSITLLFALIAFVGFSQQTPVKWSTRAEKAANNTYKVILTATMPEPWHIYSQTTPDGGPVATSFSFAKNPLINLQGKTTEKGNLKVIHDKNFGVDVKYYSNKVEFTQLVKVKGNIKTNVSGSVNFMVCNDHECLPPSDESFTVKLQ